MPTDHDAVAARLTMPLGEALFTQRAIRRFRPDPIAEDDLRDLLLAATRAPSGGNAQPWHFLVLRDRDVIAKFAALYRGGGGPPPRDQGIRGPEDIPAGKGTTQSAMRLADEIGDAPAIVLLCATAPGAGAMGSVIPAAQNLLLAARAIGIGGTITTLHAVVDERVHALLGIPPEAQVVYCIPLGYPRGRFGPAVRRPLAEVASVDRWGNALA
jgi:nitroreductase